jgi:hypothetical protein
MDDPGPLRGPDIARHLENPTSFGVSGAESPDGVQTIEFTTEPSVHGAHGSVRVHFAAGADPVLRADISWGNQGRATCQSPDSIRIWGAFRPEADLVVRASGRVRLVVRSGAGIVLAGPATLSSGLEPMSLAW